MYGNIWKAAAGHLSEERMRADIEEFFALSRWSSFDRIVTLARLIAEKMEAAGLTDVRLIDAPADGRTAFGGWVMPKAYDVEAALLRTVTGMDGASDVLADYRRNPTCLMMYSLPTPPGGITAEVAIADRVQDCQPERVAGRLVLTSAIGVTFSQAAMRAGAAGILSDGRFGRRFYKEGPFLDTTNEWHNYTIPPWDDPNKGFGFSLTPQQGARLRSLIAAGETVRLHALVKTRHYDGILPVVSGLLPGRETEEIVLTGHYDEFGADDNCSQVAVALESVRAVRAMIEAGEIPPPRRSIRLLFPMEVRGFNALIQDDEEIKNIRIGLNVDTVGTDQNAVTTSLTLTENFAALPSFAEELVASLLGRVSEENPLFRWHRSEAETIDNIFGEPLIGAPTPCLYHYSATHHLALDTPERISGRMLRDMARVAATFAAFLSNAGLTETLWLNEIVAEHGALRMREAAARALEHGAATALPQVEALHESYCQRLETTRWLIADEATAAKEECERRVSGLRQRLDHARAGAEAAIRERAADFFPNAGSETAPDPAPLSSPAGPCVPLKNFKGFLSFEDLDEADRPYVTEELGIPFGWGAPLWLQNALFFADGNRDVGQIAALLRRHSSGSGNVPDTGRLEAIFRFLERRGLVRIVAGDANLRKEQG